LAERRVSGSKEKEIRKGSEEEGCAQEKGVTSDEEQTRYKDWPARQAEKI
jgi:hypothetical protein